MADSVDGMVTGIVFRNVRYTSSMKNQLYSPEGDYVQNVRLENVEANGSLIRQEDAEKYFDVTGNGRISVENG